MGTECEPLTVQEAFYEKIDSIRAHIGRIQKLVDGVEDRTNPENVSWANVGDLCHVEEQLSEIG